MLPPYHHPGAHIPDSPEYRHGCCPGYPEHLRGMTMGQEPGQQAEPEEAHREEELGLQGLAGTLGCNISW